MRNNYFFLPVNTGYYKSGNPTPECIDFYKRRSYPDLYCSIVGNVSTLRGYGTNLRTGIISKTDEWKKLANCITDHGSIAGIQLARTWQGFSGQQQFRNEKWPEYKKYLRCLLKKVDLIEVFEDFSASIKLAVSLGFNHIQIHAAHGYLLSSLLDPHLYKYTDNTIEILNKITSQFKEVELSIRVSSFCGLKPDIEKLRAERLKHIYSGKFDYVDLSEGYYNLDKMYIYPHSMQSRIERLKRCLKVACSFPNQQFILSGWLNPLEITKDNVHKGFCRDIIANPEFAINLQEGCENCGDCHYHSQGRDNLVCRRWENSRY